MAELTQHWTQRSTADFVYSISSNFVAQLETRMEEKKLSQSDLAELLRKSEGRVSQVFNNPGNMSLRSIVEYAKALGLKVGVIAYDDGDPTNTNGPIDPNVFVKSWEKLGEPKDLFEVEESPAMTNPYAIDMSKAWRVSPEHFSNALPLLEVTDYFKGEKLGGGVVMFIGGHRWEPTNLSFIEQPLGSEKRQSFPQHYEAIRKPLLEERRA